MPVLSLSLTLLNQLSPPSSSVTLHFLVMSLGSSVSYTSLSFMSPCLPCVTHLHLVVSPFDPATVFHQHLRQLYLSNLLCHQSFLLLHISVLLCQESFHPFISAVIPPIIFLYPLITGPFIWSTPLSCCITLTFFQLHPSIGCLVWFHPSILFRHQRLLQVLSFVLFLYLSFLYTRPVVWPAFKSVTLFC